MKDYSLLNLIAIQDIFSAGSNRAYKIAQKIISENVLCEKLSEISRRVEFNDEVRIKLLIADYGKAEKILSYCEEHNISILGLNDERYPDRLKNIAAPPVVLYYRGEFPDFDVLPSITIVGPRKVSEYGKKAAFALGYRLSRAGMIIVSGGAVGCDTAVHKGVFAAEGKTALILGCGIDFNYLPENENIRNEATRTGCLISEYPPLTRPSKRTFPVRNRIMSGLTLGTIVVEAPKKSGSLITARNALEQGRDVFVIPGNPTLAEYKGSNELLRDGAKPLIDSSDIFNEYLPSFAEYLDIERAFTKPGFKYENNSEEKNFENLKEILSNEAKIVYNNLDKQIFTIDDLSGTDLSSDSVLSALTELELENLIESVPGGKYKKK